MNSEKRSAFTVIEMLVASVLATGMTIAAFLIVSTMTAKVSSVDKVNGSGEHAALRIVEVRIRNDFDLSHHYQKIETGVRLFGSCRSDQNANFRIHDECAVDYSVEPIGGAISADSNRTNSYTRNLAGSPSRTALDWAVVDSLDRVSQAVDTAGCH